MELLEFRYYFSLWIDLLSADTLQAIDENGRTFLDDVSQGDVWFFPA
jgi:hypothetical protein